MKDGSVKEMDLVSIDLLERMMDLTNLEAGSATLVNHSVQALKEDFVYCRSFLGQVVELRNEDEELQELWDFVVGVAYRAEFLIDSLTVGDDLDFVHCRLIPFQKKLKSLKERP